MTIEPKPARVCGYAARVVVNAPICRDHCAIELIAPGFPPSEPGQFLQLHCTDTRDAAPRAVECKPGGFPSLAYDDEWRDRVAFLRRPFSIGDQWVDANGQVRLAVISRNVGPGTAWLARLAPGDTVDATGPLGRGFRIPAANLPIALVGGGVGIAPLIYLARRLDALRQRDVTVIFGATAADALPVRLLAEPARDGRPLRCVELAGSARFPTVITTDDGSLGMRGVVTAGLRKWHVDRDERSPTGVVFACGPTAMLRAVSRMTRELGLECQLCIERKMGCGLGTCLSCVTRVRDESATEGWRWALVCSDGPVFDRDELIEEGYDDALDAR
jgi:dihydroorotate dehydrogenase electron transfer subunit